jgi:hypothetical protein
MNIARLRLLVGLVLLTAAIGCSTYNLHLALSDEYAHTLGDDHVFVHVVPVNPHDKEQLSNLNLDDYWQYGGTTKVVARERDTKVFDLTAQQPTAVLSKDDPIWKTWKDRGATELMILASRPMVEHPAAGEQDPRRRFIPADARAWTSRDVVIVVTANGLRVETGQKN